MQVGSIVRFRERLWVVIPEEREGVYALRPLTGGEEEKVLVSRVLSDLIRNKLPTEGIEPAEFPLPRAEEAGDAQAVQLFWRAMRFSLQDGASPLRCLSRISFTPRPYQLVPLLMALRAHPVRLFIADDVGVGKTLEALLIARELYDKREIAGFAVLCPPNLCDQWAAELEAKFHLEPVVIRSATLSRYERAVPPGMSPYRYFPVQVISIDLVKSERHRARFVQECPSLVIVDEVHGAAPGSDFQQERYQLLKALAQSPQRHLIFLSATPHSGKAEAFWSLISLLDPEGFSELPETLTRKQQERLAKIFVQRLRSDIERWEGGSLPFPKREEVAAEACAYQLSAAYRRLFEEVYRIAKAQVQLGLSEQPHQKARNWGALTLLRIVMSSPAAAEAAFRKRLSFSGSLPMSAEAALWEAEGDLPEALQDDPERVISDIQRVNGVDEIDEAGERVWRRLLKQAQALHHSPEDTKLATATQLIGQLLSEGYAPIVWCRFVATARYVAEALEKALPAATQVVCLTGETPEAERRAALQQLNPDSPRVLVATDVLSEGINLQEYFNAVVHYDLPWNPNRLWQREGRIDRFGQPSATIKVARLYGRDNPVDGAVLKVLLEKVETIYRTLGVAVPMLGEEAPGVVEAILEWLFLRGGGSAALQGTLFAETDLPAPEALQKRLWQRARSETKTRALFAQQALTPEALQAALAPIEGLLGSAEEVESFVVGGLRALGIVVAPGPKARTWRVGVGIDGQALPPFVRAALPSEARTHAAEGLWRIAFSAPAPAGTTLLNRNHRFVRALATHLTELGLQTATALTRSPFIARVGAIATSAVSQRTVLLMLRLRYRLMLPRSPSLPAAELLAEEVALTGWQGPLSAFSLLSGEAADLLFQKARPHANLAPQEKHALLLQALAELPFRPTAEPSPERQALEAQLQAQLRHRTQTLAQQYHQLFALGGADPPPFTVELLWPPDSVGVLVLVPVP